MVVLVFILLIVFFYIINFMTSYANFRTILVNIVVSDLNIVLALYFVIFWSNITSQCVIQNKSLLFELLLQLICINYAKMLVSIC